MNIYKKNPKFESAELEVLIDETSKNKDILFGSFSNLIAKK